MARLVLGDVFPVVFGVGVAIPVCDMRPGDGVLVALSDFERRDLAEQPSRVPVGFLIAIVGIGADIVRGIGGGEADGFLAGGTRGIFLLGFLCLDDGDFRAGDLLRIDRRVVEADPKTRLVKKVVEKNFGVTI